MKISWPKVPIIAIFLLVFLLIEGLPGPAPAHPGHGAVQALQLVCVESRDSLLKRLYEEYKELPTEYGVTPAGFMMEVWTSEYGETFTLLLTNPDGSTCMIVSGEGWRILPYDDTDQGPGA